MAIPETDTSKGRTRDTQLDIYRALVMIYIPCVVHLFYFYPIQTGFSQVSISMILIEMGIIFFISGACYGLGNRRISVASNMADRAKRVLLPFYVYIAACIIIAYFLQAKGYGSYFGSSNPLMYLLPIESNLNLPYAQHIWFIFPYMFIVCSFPLQQRLLGRIRPGIYVALNIIIFVAISLTGIFHEVLLETVFYNIFFICGYLYYKKISIPRLAAISAVCLLFVAAWYMYVDRVPMQTHKFPPDTVFLCYLMGMLCLLACLVTRLKLPGNRLLRLWSKEGYTIYLWQNFYFWGLQLLTTRLGVWDTLTIDRPYLGLLVFFAGLFISGTLAALTIAPAERMIIKYITSTFSDSRKFTTSPLQKN